MYFFEISSIDNQILGAFYNPYITLEQCVPNIDEYIIQINENIYNQITEFTKVDLDNNIFLKPYWEDGVITYKPEPAK